MSVYFVKADGLNVVKIGYAKRPRERVTGLQTGSPVKLNLVALIPGDKSCELLLHDKFAGQRLHGEWFNICEGIEQIIATFPCDLGVILPDRFRPRTGRPRKKDHTLPKGTYKHGRLYRAEIWIKGTKVKLGAFKTPEEAGRAYEAAAANAPRYRPVGPNLFALCHLHDEGTTA